MRLREILRELVDIHGLVIPWDVGEFESLSRNEGRDVVLVVQFHDGSVHPAFIFVDQSQCGTRVVDKRLQDAAFENNVRFEE